MKVSYRWLSEYVDLTGYTAADLAEKLTRSGIEVDGVERLNKGVQGVVVGYVKEKQKHPDADKLNVCTVDTGQGADLQIVCGAPNVAAGQKVPVAVVGAKLPDGLNIKRAKLRGVESQGMICSARELGINDRYMPKEIQEGILVLPQDLPLGENIVDVLGIEDEVLELDLTPNRSDALSMIGVAYEIAAILGREVRLPDPQKGIVTGAGRTEDHIRVTVSAPEESPLYTVRYVEDVRIAPSPLWMQYRLMAAGIRPINNVVDITNYVMIEYGQPLHAFDADKLAGGRIDVRLARDGEKLVTLDDAERTLAPHMLLITDGEKPVGLAGVMGGANSEVTPDTRRIALESAKFSGASVRRTSRQLGLRSEASLRFEKEVNPDAVVDALNRAVSLMCQYAGAKAAEGIAEVSSGKREPVTVKLSLSKVNGYLGTDLSGEAVKDILARLHFEYEEVSGEPGVYRVHVPGRRGDITQDVDLIEEVARLHGYDNIPTTLMTGTTTPGSLTKGQHIRRSLRSLLTGSGLHEVVSYSFTHPDEMARFPGAYAEARAIPLAMPMSEERSVLRTSLIPHLLDIARYNRNRNMEDAAIFEIGKAFVTQEENLTRQPEEKHLLAVLLTGSRTPIHWGGKPEPVDFYDIKGVLEKVTEALGIRSVRYRPVQAAGFHPGRTAELTLQGDDGEIFVGRIGQLHPDLQKEKDLADTYVLEVELDTLERYSDFTVQYRSLPRYPAVSRDLAVVVDKSVAVGEMLAAVQSAAGDLLEECGVFDIYTGGRLGDDRKSVALSLVYRHPERTMTDEEVAELQARVVTALEQTFAAELRK